MHVGVRQGCVVSPMLSNTVLDLVKRRATREGPGIWGLSITQFYGYEDQAGECRKINRSIRCKGRCVQTKDVAHKFRCIARIYSSEKNHC